MITTSNRLNDLRNHIPPTNVAVYTAKSIFTQHQPYTLTGSVENVLTVEFHHHFIKALRRVFSGTTASTQFSEAENICYERYQRWVDGEDLGAELNEIMRQLDQWIIDEITGESHDKFYRETTIDNPWKTNDEDNI